MNISHVGQSTIRTPVRNLDLNNIFHVPNATDKNVFLEFHPEFLFIKDWDTKNVLLKGECQHGLYPLPSTSARKQVFESINHPLVHGIVD
jgi:hypothetical protein